MKNESPEFWIIFSSIFVMAIGGYFLHLSLYTQNLIEMSMGIALLFLGSFIISNKYKEIREENKKLYS